MEVSERISVIVPVYKVEEYLNRAVESIVNQTYRNLEIILVDDGSPDACPAMCDAWAQKDSRIRVIHKENGGVSSARNAGLKAASGYWISFVDSDDWIHRQFFEILIQGGENDGDIISSGFTRTANFSECDEPQCGTLRTVLISPRELTNWKNRFYVWGKLYKRTVLNGFLFDEAVSYGEDVLWNIQIVCQPSIKVFEVLSALYYYYIRQGALTSENRPMKRIQLCETTLAYAKNEFNQIKKNEFIMYAIKRGLSTRFDLRKNKNQYKIRKQCSEIVRSGLSLYKRTTLFSIKEYAKYYSFYRFPIVYSFFRFVNDPSLLRRENN